MKNIKIYLIAFSIAIFANSNSYTSHSNNALSRSNDDDWQIISPDDALTPEQLQAREDYKLACQNIDVLRNDDNRELTTFSSTAIIATITVLAKQDINKLNEIISNANSSAIYGYNPEEQKTFYMKRLLVEAECLFAEISHNAYKLGVLNIN